MHIFFLISVWLVSLLWTWLTLSTLHNLPRVPNLLQDRFAQPLIKSSSTPIISVIVPARNEAESIELALRSLLAIRSVPIEILVIDDRSTDATGRIADRLAAEALSAGPPLTVIHLTGLPEGWMGKTHAMALAARQAIAPWLLFTDADIVFAPDSLLRAMNFALAEQADHVVIFPSFTLRTWGERMMMAIFQLLGLLGSRVWRIPDPRSKESIGIGAFNLIRAESYRAIGGFESLRMEVLEDLRLGFQVKRAGLRQRVAFGPGLLRLRWAKGAGGFIRNVTKNFFAVFRFRTLPALFACAALAVLCLGPTAALFGSNSMRIPAGIVFLMVFLLYRAYRKYNAIPAAYAVTFPLAAFLFIYAILRSIAVTLLRGGIMWRGTSYPLAELRKNSGPIR